MALRPTRRNPVARSPLLRKGGVHRRSRGGERGRENRRLQDALDEWHADRQSEAQQTEDPGKGVRADEPEA